MEIEYSNFELDELTFGKYETVGLIDINSNFLYNRIYDIRTLEYNPNVKVSIYLANEKFKNKELTKKLMDEMEITKETKKKAIKNLSTAELIKVLIVKLSMSDAKVIILNHIDSYLTDYELTTICRTLRKNSDSIKKTIIFATERIDNIILNTSRYIIAKDKEIIYNGSKLESLPIKSAIMKFVDMANKKNANLSYYKETNDLLKAIYRSVKK